jgi:hypothetical protein
MFGRSSPSGSLTLSRGHEEAVVGFEDGLLRYARLGAASGPKALVRLLGWDDGTFQFHARIEPLDQLDPPLPLEVALLEATHEFDELARLDVEALPPGATLRFVSEPTRASADEAEKVEQAVLELAKAGFTIRRVLDVIPEPDPHVLAAISFLADLGSIVIESE